MWASVYKFSPSRRVFVWISAAVWVLEQTGLNEIWSKMIILTLYKYNHWHSSEGLSCHEIHADSRSAVSLWIQDWKERFSFADMLAFANFLIKCNFSQIWRIWTLLILCKDFTCTYGNFKYLHFNNKAFFFCQRPLFWHFLHVWLLLAW